jgi:hypothetical protein
VGSSGLPGASGLLAVGAELDGADGAPAVLRSFGSAVGAVPSGRAMTVRASLSTTREDPSAWISTRIRSCVRISVTLPSPTPMTLTSAPVSMNRPLESRGCFCASHSGAALCSMVYSMPPRTQVCVTMPPLLSLLIRCGWR